MEGVEVFLDKPVRIAMGQEEERYLLKSGKSFFDMMGMPLPKIRIDFYLKEGELQLGSQTFHVHQSPGHSPGVPYDLLADSESPLYRRCGFLGRNWKDRFSRRKPQTLDGEY